nr:putative reverse transcriptase domain-containing protein [Tanacetum cinerariifolium]
KCHADEPLAVPLDGLHFDDKLHFVEEPVEIVDREVKWLKRSQIPLVKVRWNSKRDPKFTWEREDQFQKKYPHLFARTAPSSIRIDIPVRVMIYHRYRTYIMSRVGCYGLEHPQGRVTRLGPNIPLRPNLGVLQAYQAPSYQASVHQPSIPQPQVVTTNEFTSFMKANDAILKNMQTNMSSLTNSNLELKNMFGQFMKMNTASSLGLGTLPVERQTEVTKDTVPPTNNGSTKDVQPPVVQTKTPILNSDPVVAPIIKPVVAPVVL